MIGSYNFHGFNRDGPRPDGRKGPFTQRRFHIDVKRHSVEVDAQAPPESGLEEVAREIGLSPGTSIGDQAPYLNAYALPGTLPARFPRTRSCENYNSCPEKRAANEAAMIWGFGDFAGENGLDGYFTTSGVVYFSSAGDSAAISYPCTSPNAVCVGGTTISRNATTGDFEAQSVWPDTGGGPSPNEPIPSYQKRRRQYCGEPARHSRPGIRGGCRTPLWFYDTIPVNPGWLASSIGRDTCTRQPMRSSRRSTARLG